MRTIALLITLLVATLPQSSVRTDVTVAGKVLDSESRMLLPNIRVDVLDAATGDTLVSDIRSDSLGHFEGLFTIATAIDELEVPEFSIDAAYPNPSAGGVVTLRYTAPSLGTDRVQLEVFDILGRRVSPSAIEASGVYLIRLRLPDGTTTESQQFVKLQGDRVRFNVVQTARPKMILRRSAPGKTAQVGVLVAFSHPAYSDVTLQLDTEADLSGLDVELTSVFPTVQADEQTYDVTYNPEAIVLDGEARQSLMVVDSVNQRYTFDTAALTNAGITLAEGKSILIGGVAVRRITSVSEVGSATVIETEFAPITDVVQSGTIAWQHSAKFDQSVFRKATVSGKTARVSELADSLMFEFKLDSTWTFKIRIDKAPSDTVRSKMTIQITKKVDKKLTATFIGKALLRDFESTGDFEFSNSEAQSMNLENKNLQVDMELSLAAAGSGIDALNWKTPEVVLPIEFLVGPVPVTINVKVQAVLKLSVLNEASATATTKLSYNGTTGFEYNGTEIDAKQQTVDALLGTTNTDAASGIGNVVDANLGIAFPRLEVKILAVPIVPSFVVGFVVGSKLAWGPVCKSGYVSVELKAGLDLKILNLLSAKIAEKQLLYERKDSPPC